MKNTLKMFTFSNTSIGRFRLIAILEGISYLVLLCIAMPLKYFADLPDAVKYTGWVHGILFTLYIITLINVKFDANWGFKKVFVAFMASLIPFGTFILDKSLRAEEEQVASK